MSPPLLTYGFKSLQSSCCALVRRKEPGGFVVNLLIVSGDLVSSVGIRVTLRNPRAICLRKCGLFVSWSVSNENVGTPSPRVPRTWETFGFGSGAFVELSGTYHLHHRSRRFSSWTWWKDSSWDRIYCCDFWWIWIWVCRRRQATRCSAGYLGRVKRDHSCPWDPHWQWRTRRSCYAALQEAQGIWKICHASC